MRTPLSAFYVEDPFQRLIAATIDIAAGAVVVMGQEIADIEGVAGRRYVGRPATEPPPPQDWRMVSENGFSFRSLSFAMVPNPAEPTSRGTPTYLLGTGWVDKGDIHYANDAEHWSVVHSVPLEGGAGFTGIVWHPDDACFYACHNGTDPGEAALLRVRIFRSPDGHAWSLHQEFAAFSDEERDSVSGAATEAFRALCVKPENKGGVPDGVQGYDTANLRFIGPTSVDWSIDGIEGGTAGIVIEVDGNPDSGGAGLPGNVFAVSFAGGIWNALIYESGAPPFAIPTKIYVSADGGQNWVETFSTAGWYPAGIVSGAVADVGGPG